MYIKRGICGCSHVHADSGTYEQREKSKMTRDDLHITTDEIVHSNFLHACLDEKLKVESNVIEALMLLFTYDLNIRKRVKEEVGRIARENGVKKLLVDKERFGVVAPEE